MTILVTGGLGFIGSVATLELLAINKDVVVLDDLSNSSTLIQEKIEAASGKELQFFEGSLRDKVFLNKLFSKFDFETVLHFAGFKSVSESMKNPFGYYENNVIGTFNLLNEMKNHSIKDIIFSSSATVYSQKASSPVTERSEVLPSTPYGTGKYIIELMLKDLALTLGWRVFCLRYFNPVGADKSGLVGESVTTTAENLMPYLLKVAAGEKETAVIYGSDYKTIDGTGVRDYIHVLDLVEGHIMALDKLRHQNGGAGFFEIINLGTGKGYSVLEVISALEKVCGRKVSYKLGERRIGDLPLVIADPTKASKTLGWTAKRTLKEMCLDSWRHYSLSTEDKSN